MTDDGIVKVRLSGTGISKLADKIAELDGWTVLDRSKPRVNRRDPGERVYLTVRYGLPSIATVHAWLAANGWQKGPDGEAGAMWHKDGHRVGVFRVDPDDNDFDQRLARGALERLAEAEGRPLHELLTAIETGRAKTHGTEH